MNETHENVVAEIRILTRRDARLRARLARCMKVRAEDLASWADAIEGVADAGQVDTGRIQRSLSDLSDTLAELDRNNRELATLRGVLDLPREAL